MSSMDRDSVPHLTIGRAARASGVSVRALRFYERRGLVRPVSRTGSGYRLYSGELVRRVRLLKWAQGLGFSLREIARLLDSGHSGRAGETLRAQAAAKARELARTIAQLASRREALERLARCRCRGDCPILERARARTEGSEA